MNNITNLNPKHSRIKEITLLNSIKYENTRAIYIKSIKSPKQLCNKGLVQNNIDYKV